MGVLSHAPGTAAPPARTQSLSESGAAFTRQAQDALAHLFDPIHLRTHPLTRLLPPDSGPAGSRSNLGEALRRQLLETIERLRPAAKSSDSWENARAWRRYELLRLRYAEGREPAAVRRALSLAKSHFYREHASAVAAVASLLAEQFGLPAIAGDDVEVLPAPTLADETAGTGGPVEMDADEPLPRQLRPAAAAEATPLPLPLTSFVGREREIATIVALLGGASRAERNVRGRRARLLTLIGPAGTGKTRLALEVAAAVQEAGGSRVQFIDLAPIAEPSQVLPAIARALELRDASDQPLVDRLRRHVLEIVRQHDLLLVLDNFEQVVAGAPQVAALLQVSPRLQVLATSRVPLQVSGEQEFPVDPLALPALGDPARAPAVHEALQSEAVRLFVERAQAVTPGFVLTAAEAAAVVQICAYLDGLPLAIELAAARTRLMPPAVLYQHLVKSRLALLTGGARDLPPRQQTLRAAIAWSYHLLTPAEQALFRRLGVFADGCTYAAIAAIAAVPGEHEVELLDRVGSLVGRLLRREESPPLDADDSRLPEVRFRMLETIREFAHEQLDGSAEVMAIRQQHADYFLALAEEAAPQLFGRWQGAWLDRVEREHENVRQALRWLRGRGDAAAVAQGLRFGAALWRFWCQRGYLAEGRDWLAAFLALDGDAAPPAVRAAALGGAGNLAYQHGDYPQAETLFVEALALWREVGDAKNAAATLTSLGFVDQRQGKFGPAGRFYEESLALWQAAGEGDTIAVAATLNGLSAVHQQRGDYAAARALSERSLALRLATGDQWGIAATLTNLALISWQQRDYAGARALYHESLALRHRLADRQGAAVSLRGLGEVALDEGDLPAARAPLEESLALFQVVGDRPNTAALLAALGHLALAAGDLDAAYRRFDESLALRRAVGDEWGITLALEGFAALAAGRAQPRLALCLTACARAAQAASGRVRPPDQPCRLEHWLARARPALSDADESAAWAEGRAMSLPQALSRVLALSAPADARCA